MSHNRKLRAKIRASENPLERNRLINKLNRRLAAADKPKQIFGSFSPIVSTLGSVAQTVGAFVPGPQGAVISQAGRLATGLAEGAGEAELLGAAVGTGAAIFRARQASSAAREAELLGRTIDVSVPTAKVARRSNTSGLAVSRNVRDRGISNEASGLRRQQLGTTRPVTRTISARQRAVINLLVSGRLSARGFNILRGLLLRGFF